MVQDKAGCRRTASLARTWAVKLMTTPSTEHSVDSWSCTPRNTRVTELSRMSTREQKSHSMPLPSILRTVMPSTVDRSTYCSIGPLSPLENEIPVSTTWEQ
jgi:hypothetical protein